MNGKNGYRAKVLGDFFVLVLPIITACSGEKKNNDRPRFEKYETESGYCIHDNMEKTTLCYDHDGHLIFVDDPNGIFK